MKLFVELHSVGVPFVEAQVDLFADGSGGRGEELEAFVHGRLQSLFRVTNSGLGKITFVGQGRDVDEELFTEKVFRVAEGTLG